MGVAEGEILDFLADWADEGVEKVQTLADLTEFGLHLAVEGWAIAGPLLGCHFLICNQI